MEGITIYGQTKVKTLKEEFKKHFQGTLRVYFGNRVADDNATLSSISKNKKLQECKFNTDPERTVAQFKTEMLDTYGIKVKVASPDDWVSVLDTMFLYQLKEVKKNETSEGLRKQFNAENNTNESSEISIEISFSEVEYLFINEDGDEEGYSVMTEINGVIVNDESLSWEDIEKIQKHTDEYYEALDEKGIDYDETTNLDYWNEEEHFSIERHELKTNISFNFETNNFDVEKLTFVRSAIDFYNEESGFEIDEYGYAPAVRYDGVEYDEFPEGRDLSCDTVFEK